MTLSTQTEKLPEANDGTLTRVLQVGRDGQPQTSEWLHPAGFEYEGIDNAAINMARDSGKATGDELAAIENFRVTPNPEHTPARHARLVKDRIGAFDHQNAERFDRVKSALAGELKRVEAELETSAGLKSNPAHFNAIVGTLQGLPVGERVKAISDMIAAGDYSTLAAIVEAPLFLTGIPAEVRDTIKLRVLTKENPAGLKLRDALTKALARWDQASVASIRQAHLLRTGTERFSGKTEAAVAIAKAAGVAG